MSTNAGVDRECRAFLDAIEQAESRLLSWGVVDVGFSREELEKMAGAIARESGSASDLIQELMQRQWLFPVRRAGLHVYRSRMAETVRLLKYLRQWFPGRPWQGSPTLVADYRFTRLARRYPRRDRSVNDLLGAITNAGGRIAPGMRQALDAFSRRGGGLQLSQFQMDAAKSVLLDLEDSKTRGVVVSAATGTGKTLAFYLPALVYAAQHRGKRECPQVLAVYPRNELLKDQLAGAYEDARLFDPIVSIPLTVGVLNGLTPDDIGEKEIEAKGWPRLAASGRQLGWICPFMPCPQAGCNGRLFWPIEAVRATREQLRCERCGHSIDERHLILTRARLLDSPPDVLFTTAEMLNRQMFDSERGRLYGLGCNRPPRLVLLDEIHTYDAQFGAHVASLIRRWRFAIGSRVPVEFIGLSATLRNASEFFADLIGVPPTHVTAVSPGVSELGEPESAEYLMALRGDPFSGAALQGTTIQTAMLVRRCLDSQTTLATGVSGRQVFLFSDSLDGVNRLFHNLSDAESNGLAGLRTPGDRPEDSPLPDQEAAGQVWSMPVRLGHRLVDPTRDTDPNSADRVRMRLRVSRTSSQDSGVDNAADIIVASPSLEVGYDSPDVGVVIQHQAPRDSSQFLQRMGRAGRHAKMRPWKMVVLSDYGRDRLAYQSHDQLFDPELKPRSLAVSNRSILRIQCVFAFMDWIARRTRSRRMGGSVWNDFARPWDTGSQPRAAGRQHVLAQVIGEVMDQGPAFQELCEYLRGALRLSEEELQIILWEPPRGLLTAVLPTLWRRLTTHWTRAFPGPDGSRVEYHEVFHPLPEFVPGELFSDLNLPEVVVRERGSVDALGRLPISQAMRLFAPGNVTRRFAPWNPSVSHWVTPVDGRCPVDRFLRHFEEIGRVQCEQDGQVVDMPCLRPWVLDVDPTPANVAPTSRGFLQWQSQLAPTVAQETVPVPIQTSWSQLVIDLRFCTHRTNAPAIVRRFAPNSIASIRRRPPAQSGDMATEFVLGQPASPVAIGFALESDAVAFRVRIPDGLAVLIDRHRPDLTRSLRTAFFRHLLEVSPDLDGLANVFQRQRLADLMLSALTAWACRKGVSLKEAREQITATGLVRILERTVEVIFQSVPIEGMDHDDPNNGQDDDDHHYHQPLQKAAADLQLLLAHPAVQALLLRLLPVLWGDFGPPFDVLWNRWLRDRFRSTLGHALLQAVHGLCPQFASSDVYLDLDGGVPIPGAVELDSEHIWISEGLPGGSGLIEAFQTAYADDPMRFFAFVDSALEPSEFEIVDAQLSRAVSMVRTDPHLATLFAAFRTAEGHEDLRRHLDATLRGLASRGVLLTHGVRVGLSSRVLRPGTSDRSDEMLDVLLRRWTQEEERLGIELDARVFSFVAAGLPEVEQALRQATGQLFLEQNEPWRVSQVYGMLWARGAIIRGAATSSYNPFAPHPAPDRLVVLAAISASTPSVSIADAGWRQQLASHLTTHGIVELRATLAEGDALSHALVELSAMPFESGVLELFPQLHALRTDPEGYSATLRFREIA